MPLTPAQKQKAYRERLKLKKQRELEEQLKREELKDKSIVQGLEQQKETIQKPTVINQIHQPICSFCDAIISFSEAETDIQGRCYFCRNYDTKEEAEKAKYRLAYEGFRS